MTYFILAELFLLYTSRPHWFWATGKRQGNVKLPYLNKYSEGKWAFPNPPVREKPKGAQWDMLELSVKTDSKQVS